MKTLIILLLFTTTLYSQKQEPQSEEPILYVDVEVFEKVMVLMLHKYLDQRDSVMVHEKPDNMHDWCFYTVESGCTKPLHYKMKIETPTFEKFVNYILRKR